MPVELNVSIIHGLLTRHTAMKRARGEQVTVLKGELGNKVRFFLMNLNAETFKEFITAFFRKRNLGTSRYAIRFCLLAKYQVF